MQHLRIAIPLVLSIFITASCNNQKEKKQPAKNVSSSLTTDTLNGLTAEAISMQDYTNSFTASISQQFIVSHKKVTVINGKKGLQVTVDPSRLIKADGSAVDGKINVQLIELTNSKDLFKSNMATISDGRLLASGGSYFIGMKCKGQSLKLKEGRMIQVNFPRLTKEEMELFYGERNSINGINWKRAAVLLEPQYEQINFSYSNRVEANNIPPVLSELKFNKVYKSLDESVYYYKTKMTLQQLVDTLNVRSSKVYLQVVSYWPKNLPTGVKLDTNYLTSVYGPRKQYILRSCKAMEEEEMAKLKMIAARDSAIKQWKPKTLAGQIQKYYAPANLTNLGWINCDRFYDREKQIEVEIELPITFNKSRVEYFVIFQTFNGLLNNRINLNETSKMVIANMPVGEKVTLVAFTKQKGVIYQLKENFVIERNKKISAGFSPISEEEMKNIFAGNISI